jgi:4-aminobutyrate aminotransferase-like enzyme
MSAATRTWISSTLATEFVSLAAALAVIQVYQENSVTGHLARVGSYFYAGLERLAQTHRSHVRSVRGVPQMCYLKFESDEASGRVALAAARRGVLLKRTAYNFVSLAHTEAIVDSVLNCVDECMTELDEQC